MKKNTRDLAYISRALTPRNRSGVLDISFGWLFALIAGAVIIFLAIYLSSKLIGTEKETVSAETGKEIGILLNPLETSFESAQTTSISIPTETRIHNTCDETGSFGRQVIQLDQKNFGKWTKTEVDVSFENKYIFSNKEMGGKKFYIFSKPFSFPFKVADLIYMSSSNERYCFMNAPEEIVTELTNLNRSNLITKNCSLSDIKVCFSGNCQINVDYGAGSVKKGGKIVYFAGTGEDSKTLMYAAIFSDADVYECQLKRLMLRVKELSQIYGDKSVIVERAGCENNLREDLAKLSSLADGFGSSTELELIKLQADDVAARKEVGICILW
ncbi:hypothetical protein A3K64_01745 [Candidatus Micrarchaeota archaeon RBG_16_36_9]|nr:MAG: hypothetical protein A3K64_01745 [Candidatus Micrarchaeota archaeon RBG_16_36_9]